LVDPQKGEVSRWTAGGEILDTSAVPVKNETIRGIAAGNRDRLWLLLDSGKTIISYQAETKKADRIELPDRADISVVTAAGDALWYADANRRKIGRVKDGWITEHSVNRSLAGLHSLTVSGNRVWFNPADGPLAYMENGLIFNVALPDNLQANVLRGDDQNNVWMLNGKTLSRVMMSSVQRADARHE
jgi:hypothetical protein